MFLYDKKNILEGSGIFEVDFPPSHGPANSTSHLVRAGPVSCSAVKASQSCLIVRVIQHICLIVQIK